MMGRSEVSAGAPEKQRDEVQEPHGGSKRRRSSVEQLHGKRIAARQDEPVKVAAVKAEPAASHDEDDVHEDTQDVDEDQERDEGVGDTEGDEGEEEEDDASMQEGPALPAGATLSPLAQHALRVVEDSWPHSQASQQDEEEELRGAQLLGMARLAWSTAGEQEQMANKLARALVDTAEALFLVRCLTLSRFSRLFAWMSAARAAASSAAALIAAAQGAARGGNAAAAAAALGSASEVAAAGEPAAGSAASDGGGPPGSTLHPAVRAAAAAAAEAAELVLAPRCCLEARLKLASLLALDPAHQQDLGTVEALLVSALEVAEAAQEAAGSSLDLEDDLQLPGSSSSSSLKLRSLEVLTKATLGKLCMLLCQEGRDSEARGFLLALSYRYRLSRGVLHYQMPAAATSNSDQTGNGGKGADPGNNEQQQQQHQQHQQAQLPQHLNGQEQGVAGGEAGLKHTCAPPACYVQAVDGALPKHMLQLMRANFSPTSPFWSQHGYNQDSPYFSYVHPLGGQHRSAMDQVISHIHGVACRHFPRVAEARYAEWWAHCRPHGSGHQMHFDSDNEGVGEVRNPIISTVLYLTGGGIGGPTLVTDQAFSSTKLASRGWLVHPEVGRLTMFDGSVLHGVIPGRGPSPRPGECRVTFMVAFWRDIRTRPRADGLPGASQPFPLLRGSCPGTAPGAAAGAAGQAASEGAAATAAATGVTSAEALQHSGEECGTLPGPESFGSSLLPSWQHNWQEAFPLQHGPEWVAHCGRAGAPAAAAATSTSIKETVEVGTASAGMTAEQHVAPLPVAPAEVMPVWEEVDPRACHAKGYALDQLKGLPAYKLCFQGF